MISVYELNFTLDNDMRLDELLVAQRKLPKPWFNPTKTVKKKAFILYRLNSNRGPVTLSLYKKNARTCSMTISDSSMTTEPVTFTDLQTVARYISH